MSSLRYPIKLDDDYPCRGQDASGGEVHFLDLLCVGDRVGAGIDGDVYPPFGFVVERENGLWIESARAA